MRRKSHLLALNFVGILFFQGCYTQLAMFYPDPEIQEDSFYENYSHAPPRPGLDNYAQDGAGTSLELAYASMYNRFHSPYGMYYGINNYSLKVSDVIDTIHPLRILNHPLGVVHQFPQLVRQDLFLQVVLLPALLLLVHHQVDDEQRAVINFTNF